MDRSLDVAQLQPACEPTIDYATALNRVYAQTPELLANGAANDSSDASAQDSDECESASPRLTPVDELLAIEHWKPAEAQYCKAIADHYRVGKRSIQKWFVELLNLVQDIAPEVVETDLRHNDRYSPLAVELLGHRYFTGSSKKWAIVLAEQYGDRLQALQPAQSAAPEPPSIEPEVLPQTAPEPESSSLIVVPKSQIEVLNSEQKSELEAIHALYVKPEPVKKFRSIALNGDQETILEGVKMLHSVVSQIKAENEQIKTTIDERENNVALANEAIEVLKQEGKSAVAENFDLVQKAEELHQKESDAKKRLKTILQTLGDF